jgi:hypothetical protein
MRRLVPSSLLSHCGGGGRGDVGEVGGVEDVDRGDDFQELWGFLRRENSRPRLLDGDWGGRGGVASFVDRRSTQKKWSILLVTTGAAEVAWSLICLAVPFPVWALFAQIRESFRRPFPRPRCTVRGRMTLFRTLCVELMSLVHCNLGKTTLFPIFLIFLRELTLSATEIVEGQLEK